MNSPLFEQKLGCLTGKTCFLCRTNAAWRQQWVRAGIVEAREFDCPRGITKPQAVEMRYDQRPWPAHIVKIAAGRAAGDRGVGDVLKREGVISKPCDISALNAQFPFKPTPPTAPTAPSK